VQDAVNREKEVAQRDATAPPKQQTGAPPANVNVVDRGPAKPNQPPPEPVPATSVLPNSDGSTTRITKPNTNSPTSTASKNNGNVEIKDAQNEEGDGESDDTEQGLNGPVQLLVRTSVSQAKIGQTVVVAVYAMAIPI